MLARENGPAAAAADTGNEPASAETTPLRGAGTGLPTALRVLDGPSLLCSSDAGTSLLRRDRGPIHVAAPMLVLADAARAGCGVDWHVLVLPRDPRCVVPAPCAQLIPAVTVLACVRGAQGSSSGAAPLDR